MADDDVILMDLLGVYRRPVVPPPVGPKGRPPGKGNQTPSNPVGTNPPGEGGSKGGGGSQGKGKGAPGQFGGGSPGALFVHAHQEVVDMSSTGALSITFTPSGDDWTPKAVIIHTALSTALNTVEDAALIEIGVATAADEQYAIDGQARDNSANEQTRRCAIDDSCIIGRSIASDTIILEVALTGFKTNGADFTIKTALGTARVVNFLFLGGPGLKNAKAFKLDLVAAGATATANLGFEPNFVYGFTHNVNNSGAFNNGTPGEPFFGTGMAISQFCLAWDGSTVMQGSTNFFIADGSTSGDPRTAINGSRIHQGVIGGALATVPSDGVTATGFEVDVTVASLANTALAGLALEIDGAKVWVANLSMPTVASTMDVTGPGFQPVVGFAFPTTITPANSGVVVDTGNAGSMGSGWFAETGACISVTDQDLSATINTSKQTRDIALSIDLHDQAAGFDATHTFDSLGFNLIFSQVPSGGGAREGIFAAIGSV